MTERFSVTVIIRRPQKIVKNWPKGHSRIDRFTLRGTDLHEIERQVGLMLTRSADMPDGPTNGIGSAYPSGEMSRGGRQTPTRVAPGGSVLTTPPVDDGESRRPTQP